MIVCLMVKGRGLSDAARTALLATARQMVLHERTRQKIVNDDCMGWVETNFARYSLGGLMAGYAFTAELSYKRGTTKAEFLVRDSDLEDLNLDEGYWTTLEEIAQKAQRPTKSKIPKPSMN